VALLGEARHEVELHGPDVDPPRCPSAASLLGERIGVEAGLAETWPADVDPGSMSAATCAPGPWRSTGAGSWGNDSGAEWFADGEAGTWLRGLWGRGQRLDADRLLDQVSGRRLDFGRLAAELS
jgi:hypothetical protein